MSDEPGGKMFGGKWAASFYSPWWDISASSIRGSEAEDLGMKLFIACCFGEVDVVKDVLTKRKASPAGFDVSKTFENDARKSTALHEAVKSRSEEIVRLLLANDADVNACDGNGQTPLLLAVVTGTQAIVQVLLDHDADVNQADKRDVSPLHFAAELDRTEILEMLLARGGTRHCFGEDSPLIRACISGSLDTLNLLLQRMEYGLQTYPSTHVLLACIIDGYARDRKAKCEAVIEKSIQFGFPLSGTPSRPVYDAHERWYSMSLIANPLICLSKHWAHAFDHKHELMVFFMEHFDVNSTCVERNHTPIHYSVSVDDVESVRLLLTSKCIFKDCHLVVEACQRNNCQILEMLLASGHGCMEFHSIKAKVLDWAKKSAGKILRHRLTTPQRLSYLARMAWLAAPDWGYNKAKVIETSVLPRKLKSYLLLKVI